jgi:hypothetical protein
MVCSSYLFGKILYFSNILDVLNLVWLWITLIVWSKDLALCSKQFDMRKINSTTLEFKRKNKNSCLTSCKEKLRTTTKVTNTYTFKTQTKPLHKHNSLHLITRQLKKMCFGRSQIWFLPKHKNIYGCREEPNYFWH